MRYWRIGTTWNDAGIDEWPRMQESGRIALGYGDLGDLTYLLNDPQRRDKLLTLHKNREGTNARTKAGNLKQASQHGRERKMVDYFIAGMAPGDVVVASKGQSVRGIGLISNWNYSFNNEFDFPHMREVEWLSSVPWKLPNPGWGPQKDVFKITNPSVISKIIEHIADRIEEADAVAPGGQGFGLSAKERKLVEDHAMSLAGKRLRETWTEVDDVSRDKCGYDILWSNSSARLQVEVKGTTGWGNSVILTAHEVEIARASYPDTALIVVSNISLIRNGTSVTPRGGDLHSTQPWKIDTRKLKPTQYRYTLDEK